MRKFSLNLVLIVLIFVVGLFTTTLSASAHVTSLKLVKTNTATGKVSVASCGHLQVYLHGTQAPTSKCLDRKIGPNIYPVPCDRNSLIIWADTGFTGWTICFKGYGATDMTNYCGPAPFGCTWNWNDQASSYQPGCSPGTFYTAIGQEGQYQNFQGRGYRENFDGQGGRLPNDTLSSVFLASGCT